MSKVCAPPFLQILGVLTFLIIGAAYLTNRDLFDEKKNKYEYDYAYAPEPDHEGSSYVSYRSLAGKATWLDSRNALFVLAFLLGEAEGGEGQGFECLNRLSCLEDERAHDLLTVSKMFLKVSKFLKPLFGSSLDDFERATSGIQEALDHRRGGGSCDSTYTCKAMPSL
ncbi:uncharacterized protein LOC143034845 [Oratosquilla oratoria]|uniref:uncharacterized protein LOC143034845 n=1 Tax=Oratosquilla oratoria TaxID=337810 RepID=UPI003F76CB49